MTFEDTLNQAVAMLQRQGRLTYQTLQLQFHLDDRHFEALKDQLLYAHPQTVTDDGRGLVWTGKPPADLSNQQSETDGETRFHAVLSAIIIFLQHEKRATYRELQYAFGFDDELLEDIQKVLQFKRLAIDEEGEGLVWTGETDPTFEFASVSLTRPDVALEAQPNSVDSLPSDVAPPTAERRQLTVMFCDLVGSTYLSGKLDPEDLREVVRAYQETAAEVVQRYEGHIAQYLGDGLLIYFGYPIAHEDDAQRAVHTGLGIIEAMDTLNTRLNDDFGIELAVRIGIHTGPVVVGEMGGGERHENLALGETPNIAARLEGLGQPNTVVISLATAQLVQRSFILEEIDRHELKGVAEPMMLYAVVGSRETNYDEHEEMLSGGFDALVGRDEEIGLLRRRWEQSKEGHGQVVLISGEAGLGKSSLVEGLRSHVRQEGYTRITFRCSPYTANSAMHPVIEHVQRVLGWQREDSTEIRLDKLEQALHSTNLPLEETVPLFATLLSLSMPEDRYAELTLSPQRQRQLTQDALVAWMLEEAERHPVLAVWEDLHWADPSTLELLGLFIEQTPTVSILNVLAYRPEFVPPWPAQSHMSPITLNRLERTHIEALVRGLAGDKTLPTELVEHVVGKTDGVPLYIEELTKMLLESDLLKEEAEAYVLTGALSSASIPTTLQDSLMARLDSLPDVKEVAQLGSVLGREFDYEMLQASHMIDESTLQAGLNQLVNHQLLYQRGRIPRAKYIFRHVLIRDAAYQSMLRRTRQHHYQRIVHTLEAQFPEMVETQPELLAHHCTEAGLNEQAVGYWHHAGRRAIERFANVEAIGQLTQGLDLLDTFVETSERTQWEWCLLTNLGPALMAAKGPGNPEVEPVYKRAYALSHEVVEPEQRFATLRGLINVYLVRGYIASAYELSGPCHDLAQELQDLTQRKEAYWLLGITHFFGGELTPALAHFEQGIALDMPDHLPSHHVLQHPHVGCLVYAALTLYLLGYSKQALAYIEDALALIPELSHPYNTVWCHSFAGWLYALRREPQMAQVHAETNMRLGEEQGFLFFAAVGKMRYGSTLVLQDQVAEGIRHIQQGLDAYKRSGAELVQPYYLGFLVEAYLAMGQPEEGLAIVANALNRVDQTGEQWYEAELHRLQGELLLRQDSTTTQEAESCFHHAISIAQSQSAKSWELRAATSLARLWQSQNKCQHAYELLDPVYEWFTEGFETADLQEAKALLTELGT